MSEEINFKKWLIRFVKEDLRIILTFMFVILLITFGFAWMMGVLAYDSVDFRTPAINPVNKADLADSDKDSLPDIIETGNGGECEWGDPVYDPTTGERIGYCTNTSPTDGDTDNDLFTDAVEDAMGTDPNSFWSPGWIYIIILIYLAAFIFFRVFESDPLKEYREFEMKASSGVSGGGGKYAYGGKSVFDDKKATEATEEERKKAIAQDQRFQRMTAEGEGPPPEKIKKKRNIGALVIQLAIATLLSIFIFIVLRN